MGENSKIQWTDHTFNPWTGCSKVSPGCANCYAESWAKRSGMVKWGDDGTRRVTSDANWRKPLKWAKDAASEGVRKRVFCASLADVFEDRPELVKPRQRLWDLIRSTAYSLDWLLLTKRPEHIDVPEDLLPLIWLGTTVENRAMADRRIPLLLKHRPAVRFLSVEPMLGPLKLERYLDCLGMESCPNCGDSERRLLAHEDVEWSKRGSAICPECNQIREATGYDPVTREYSYINWVICGSESGHGARSCSLGWVRDLRDQCRDAGVPFFLKQLMIDGDLMHMPELDGKQWSELPEVLR